MMAKTTSFFVLFAIVAGIGAVAPAAFGDHSEVTITTSGGNTPGCEETDTCYDPSEAVVDVGGTVIMKNTEEVFTIHTFTSGTIDDNKPMPDEIFHFQLNNGESAEWEPDTAGKYPYYCAVHPWMKGTITVQVEEEESEEMESMENPNESEVPDPNDETGDIDALEIDEEMEMKEGDMMKGDDMEEGEMMMDGKMMEGSEIMVEIDDNNADDAKTGDQLQLDITVTVMSDNEEEDVEHFNYDIVAMQSGQIILEDTGVHSHKGKETHTTNPLLSAPSDAPITVKVTSKGFGLPDTVFTGPIDVVVAEKEIIPEFGSIAMMILAVSVISIVAITAKSRIVPRI